MKLAHLISIDLLEFVKTGRFDFIKLGQTKDWILNNFPAPDGFDEAPDTYAHPIWRYGNIEFHFTQNQLSLIFSDYIDTLDGGESLELDKWIFAEPQKLTLSYVLAQLNQQRISFSVEHKAVGDFAAADLRVLASGVMLSFTLAEQDDESFPDFMERNRVEDSNLFLLQSLSFGM